MLWDILSHMFNSMKTGSFNIHIPFVIIPSQSPKHHLSKKVRVSGIDYPKNIIFSPNVPFLLSHLRLVHVACLITNVDQHLLLPFLGVLILEIWEN